jgi:hypothetical protein
MRSSQDAQNKASNHRDGVGTESPAPLKLAP